MVLEELKTQPGNVCRRCERGFFEEYHRALTRKRLVKCPACKVLLKAEP